MLLDLIKVIVISAFVLVLWWGDIWGMDGSNPVAARAARASIGTGTADSTTNNRGSTTDGSSASDRGGHREAQRHNRQTPCKAEWKLLVPKPTDL
jgi:hypothetical protein